jgi:hypothetical protein
MAITGNEMRRRQTEVSQPDWQQTEISQPDWQQTEISQPDWQGNQPIVVSMLISLYLPFME